MFLFLGIALMIMVAMLSTTHALGIWLVMLVTHGIFVLIIGDSVINMPFYAGVAMTIIILMKKDWEIPGINIILVFAVLITLMLISAIQGINHEHSIGALLMYFKAFMLALLIAGCIKTDNDIKLMTQYCLAGLVIGAVYAIYQYATNTFVIDAFYSQRAAGLRGDPNETAMLLVSGISLAVYWILNEKVKYKKLLYIAIIPILLFGIMLTQSRGGLVALFFVMFLIYIKKPTVPLTLLGVLFITSVGFMASDRYWQRMGTLISGEGTGVSISGRSHLLTAGAKIFINNPILGVGPGNFGNSPELYTESGRALGMSHQHAGVEKGKKPVAHNLYLEFFVETGLFAGVLLLVILYQSIRHLLSYDKFWRKERTGSFFGVGYALAVAMAGILFAGLFLSQGKNSVLWFLIGLGFAAGRIMSLKNSKVNVMVGEQSIKHSQDEVVKNSQPVLRLKSKPSVLDKEKD